MIRRSAVVLLVAGCLTFAFEGASAPPASAGISVCGIAGAISGVLGKACDVVSGPVGKLAGKLFGGGGGGGGGGGSSTAAKVAGLAAVGVWAYTGARFALKEASKVLGQSTKPQLSSTWFSGTYWRMTEISALLTLPFLFAAAVQAMMRSDLSMLARAAFGYLPLAALAIAIAAPLTTLLLAASDEMSSLVASASGSAGVHVLRGAGLIAGFSSILIGSPFFVFVVAGLTIAGALALWLELVVREAAVYVIVLMLPLAFAAMVWPARRVWAIRAVELLVALILSKFAIVAVLTLGAGAVNGVGHGVGSAVAGIALLLMATFAPWALMRLLPLAELASGAVGGLRREVGAGAPLARLPGRAAAADGSEYDGDGRGGPDHSVTEIYDQAADTPTPPPRWGGDDRTPAPEHELVAALGGGSNGGGPSPGGGVGGSPSGGGPSGAPAGGGPSGGSPGGGGSAGGPTGATPLDSDTGGPAPSDSVGLAPASSGDGPRIPGLGATWQAADGQHRPITLGSEDDLTPVWPHQVQPPEPPTGEDHDPRPERQPPDGAA